MSDFLSNFESKKYKSTLNQKEEKKSSQHSPSTLKKKNRHEEIDIEDIHEEYIDFDDIEEKEESIEKKVDSVYSLKEDSWLFDDEEDYALESETELSRRNQFEEETEIDPTYQNKKRKKIILLALVGIIVCLALFIFYYSSTHVKLPEFVNKPVSEARVWSEKNKMTLSVKQEYKFDIPVNNVIKQDISPGKNLKKGLTITLVASLGPDPSDKIGLADFASLSKESAIEWVKKNKAENLTILEEYSDTVEKGKFIRQEIKNKDVTPTTYERKDMATVYYSKGPETFEKNISMPDFKGKSKTEVEAWVKTNEIKMTYNEVDSDKIEPGMIVAQSVAKDVKIAKRDEMAVEVSIGKAFIVPNFADYNLETAGTISNLQGVNVVVKSMFSNSVPFGQLVWQSTPAGEKVLAKDSPTINVTYSAGRPYLRSYVGKLEGDLPQAFFEDYQSKGANIRYTVNYVDSAKEKGSVVSMSAYNQYVPIDFVVTINISKGNLTAPINNEDFPSE